MSTSLSAAPRFHRRPMRTRLVRRLGAEHRRCVVSGGCSAPTSAGGRRSRCCWLAWATHWPTVASRLDERARGVAEAQRDETQRLASLTRLLGRIERKEVKPPDAPYRDPRNAIYVGRGQAATVAYLPNAPLAITAVGLSDLYPHVFKVSAGSKDSFLFVDEIANPTHLLSGSFDLAFVIVYLYPLLLLAISYNVLSGEQEQGTLALTVASSARLTTVLAGKLFVRAGGLIAAAVVGCWCLLLAHGRAC